MSIIKAIDNCFKIALQRKWKYTYWAFDIHGTMIEPNYKENIPTIFYPYAIEVLQEISKRVDIKTILYTCSHAHEIEQYLKILKSNSINFDFIHENTDVVTDKGYGCYDKKPYFNVLFEDKAGFDPLTDWKKVKKHLKYYPETYLK